MRPGDDPLQPGLIGGRRLHASGVQRRGPVRGAPLVGQRGPGAAVPEQDQVARDRSELCVVEQLGDAGVSARARRRAARRASPRAGLRPSPAQYSAVIPVPSSATRPKPVKRADTPRNSSERLSTRRFVQGFRLHNNLGRTRGANANLPEIHWSNYRNICQRSAGKSPRLTASRPRCRLAACPSIFPASGSSSPGVASPATAVSVTRLVTMPVACWCTRPAVA